MTDLNFTPCSPDCPAVTGKPLANGSTCPMADPAKHARFNEWLETHDNSWDFKRGGFPADLDQHPDRGDCCLNFQCCINEDTPPEDVAILKALGFAASDPEEQPHIIDVDDEGVIDVRTPPRDAEGG